MTCCKGLALGMRATMSQQPPTTHIYITCVLGTYDISFLPKNDDDNSNVQVPEETIYLVMVYNVYDVSP